MAGTLAKLQQKLFGPAVDLATIEAERARLTDELASLEARKASAKAGLDLAESAADHALIQQAKDALLLGQEAAERERRRLDAADGAHRAKLIEDGRARLGTLIASRVESLAAARRAAERILDMEREARGLWVTLSNATTDGRRASKAISDLRSELAGLGASDLPDITEATQPEDRIFFAAIGRSLHAIQLQTPTRSTTGPVLEWIMASARNWRR